MIFQSVEYNTRCTLFPLTEVFSHWIFLARFLMRQQMVRMVRIKRYVYSFSFTRIFSHRVFPSRVLTRHIIYGHPRGSVINSLNEWIVHKVVTWTTIHIHYIHEPFWIRMYLFIMILNMVTFGVISHSINRVVHSLL